MKRNGKRELIWGLALLLAFLVWTALVRTVDVLPLGAGGTNIGFAAFNVWFFNRTGVHMALYTLTDWLGLVPIFVCFAFGGIGLCQLINRKSFLKVDRDILWLGAYYIVVIFGYLIFEMIPVNYRPILINGHLEASYPSSTTLLVLCVMLSLLFQAKRRMKNEAAKQAVCLFAGAFSVLMVAGRLVAGVHWFSDIFGGVLLSFGLFYLYKGAVLTFDEK